jgi:hypothetical protein
MEQKRNLWVIPTDKPSRLWLSTRRKHYLIFDKFARTGVAYVKPQNICITSDKEIKEENLTKSIYVIDVQNGNIGKLTCKNRFFKGSCKLIGIEWSNKQDIWNYNHIREIILTTDQDLIKDGVQAIDNDFLEWFVAHPSCEFVEVEKFRSFKEIHSPYEYMIIIPKEETKFEDSIENSINIMSIANSMFSKKEEPKQSVKEYEQQGLEKYSYELEQETLEEAAKRAIPDNFIEVAPKQKVNAAEISRHYFIAGAEWQEERMYSYMDKYADYCLMCSAEKILKIPMLPKEWFEQFKKK